ncbi:helix-turn-helix transcriptional regulator [Vibrio kasasachensis]|uniref:helix-turn-helix transcriptional regulator n=1 Tax=Vibrio kasasachensis TaxID=2910248 RepID=UPI003D1261CE
MFFHQIVTSSVSLQPFRTKQSLLIRADGYSGEVIINGTNVTDYDQHLLVIPEGSLVQCNIKKDNSDGKLELFTINKRDIINIKAQLISVNSFILDRKNSNSYIVTKNNDLCDIFELYNSFAQSDTRGLVRNIAIKQSIFHLLLTLYMQGQDIGILFQQDFHLSLSDRLTKLFMAEPKLKWTLENTAQRIFTSNSTLRRNLARENTSFSNILNDVRLGIAINYLTFTNFGIQKVAELSGFNSSAYFCTIFKKKHGITPQQFRLSSKKSNL